MKPAHLVFIAAITVHGGFLSAENTTPENPTQNDAAAGCSAEIRGNRPKIYIADFLVTYGKKDMGQAIGDFIAEKFEADGRFEIVQRKVVTAEMQPVLKKNPKAEKYLATTVNLTAEKNADCVIFGRISRKDNRVFFLVRMASVATGENLRKVDTEVDRDKAMGFLESVGDSFVSFFVAAPPTAVAASDDTTGRHRGFYLNFLAGGGHLSASKPVGSDSFSIESFAGHTGLKVGGAVRPDIILHASIDGFPGNNPTGKITLSGPGSPLSVADLTHAAVTGGAGFTVYSEANYFFSAALGIATGILGYSGNGISASGNSGYGFGLNLAFGREWWVARRFGIGAALVAHYSNLPANSVSMNQYYAGLALSATYN